MIPFQYQKLCWPKKRSKDSKFLFPTETIDQLQQQQQTAGKENGHGH